MKTYLLVVQLLIYGFTKAQQNQICTALDQQLIKHWQQAGASIPNQDTINAINPIGTLATKDLGNYTLIDGADLQTYLEQIKSDKIQKVIFPSGNYQIQLSSVTPQVKLPSNIILAGEGSNKTIFEMIFHPNVYGNCFEMNDTNTAIEDLKIDLTKAFPSHYTQDGDSAEIASANNSVVAFNSAFNCWIKGVEIEKGLGSSIGLYGHSKNISVQGCYIHDAWLHGHHLDMGTQGYGISLNGNNPGIAPSYCLIENNIIEKCRHNINLQYHSYYNVISYNYTRLSRAYTVILNNRVNWSTSDIVLHGNSPNRNLIESNYFEGGGAAFGITIDNVKVTDNGILNTLYRNYGNTQLRLQIKSCNYNDSQILIANQFSGYNLSSFGHHLKFNVDLSNNIISSLGNNCMTGTNNSNDTNNLYGTIGKSCYLDTLPCWLNGLTIPLIGPNVGTMMGIPASLRYKNNLKTFSVCSKTTSLTHPSTHANDWDIYPNPSKDLIHVSDSGLQIIEITLHNQLGQKITLAFTGDTLKTIDISSFDTGIYILTLRTDSGSIRKKFVKTDH